MSLRVVRILRPGRRHAAAPQLLVRCDGCDRTFKIASRIADLRRTGRCWNCNPRVERAA